ncbi:MAG: spore coat associated protein CotJA [Clostridiales bacterium]|nr:spore coat associated protein CotJA [Clostridiales bacterium]
MSPTMMYVPFQTDTTVYDDMKALEEGTLFPVLNKPFMAGSGCCK